MSIPRIERAVADEAGIQALVDRLGLLRHEIAKVIVGQDAPLDQLLTAFLAGGHCLLEGVPGLAKTLMIRTLARGVELSFQRIQFTPDLMPTDILGTDVLEEDQATGKRFFTFVRGPVFANILLADEINRTPPKTQAALLEAMQERAVTYGGTRYALDPPFFVLATQNPIEQAGTYPLPEAQLDRFLLHVRIEYPSQEEEFAILTATTGNEEPAAEAVLQAEDVLTLQRLVRDVPVADALIDYANRIVRETRPEHSAVEYVREWVRWGAGPRAGQSLILTAKARAVLRGRFGVTLEDLQTMIYPVLRHRILLNFKAEAERIRPDDVTRELLAAVSEPASPLR
jgi:MoxR-like ATPase